MKQLLMYLLNALLGTKDTKEIDRIERVEIIRRQNVMIKEIEKCDTPIKLLNCKRAVPVYITNAFDYSKVETSLAIINSHIKWKIHELKRLGKWMKDVPELDNN